MVNSYSHAVLFPTNILTAPHLGDVVLIAVILHEHVDPVGVYDVIVQTDDGHQGDEDESYTQTLDHFGQSVLEVQVFTT